MSAYLKSVIKSIVIKGAVATVFRWQQTITYYMTAPKRPDDRTPEFEHV